MMVLPESKGIMVRFESGLLVPALLLGVPRDKGFMLAHPRAGEFDGLGLRGAGEDGGQRKRGQKRLDTAYDHANAPQGFIRVKGPRKGAAERPRLSGKPGDPAGKGASVPASGLLPGKAPEGTAGKNPTRRVRQTRRAGLPGRGYIRRRGRNITKSGQTAMMKISNQHLVPR